MAVSFKALTGAVFVYVTMAPLALAESPVQITTSSQRVNTRVVSLLEMRERNLVRQGWDMSCGAAALSTVLGYHFGAEYSEATIAATILSNTDPDRIRARGGFSLLDLKRFAEAVGYSANGYANLALEDLAAANVPAILPVRIRNLDHFVVFRGRVAGKVLIGDPAFGNLTMSERRFAKVWTNGIGFLVKSVEAEAPTWRSEDATALTVPDLNYVYRFGATARPVPVTRR
ncbi:MAG: C39 family peptidase [Gammaproteobacteria bacterium]